MLSRAHRKDLDSFFILHPLKSFYRSQVIRYVREN